MSHTCNVKHILHIYSIMYGIKVYCISNVLLNLFSLLVAQELTQNFSNFESLGRVSQADYSLEHSLSRIPQGLDLFLFCYFIGKLLLSY